MADDDERDYTARSDNTAEEKSRARIDRARLARIFGDALPDTTKDERGVDEERSGDSDEWLKRQVPPHHG
ncbi:hypothetical protein ACFWCF_06720 [Rhodococcus sp. NPDC060090]|uniref:hypothetical protein n=1 Tax=Rhodococcus sp. NPDC060090 TaxID=3347056 RepID=UPI003663737F